ncbi:MULTISPECIES: sensor histidine kinase [Pontibacillus]|uniref:Histidine kinase n=1 Tax=Pontibacillus chungwhensis TaxID=265426 RepID=A0ABY8V1M0_9BACI|nr:MULTISPECIES: histidine kinase [Pontibacillus]MCD5324175.1 histidine kinase [Pontibacillus sp. HN14]WIF97766.1 histidine kinase [Pontibacillus chungwhensis]
MKDLKNQIYKNTSLRKSVKVYRKQINKVGGSGLITLSFFTTMIVFSIIAPIAAAITLFMILAFERELDFLKSQNVQVQLEKELQYSEYMQLNQQIQPHFLFNTMNLLLGLARLRRIDQLIEVMEHFSKFLQFKYHIKDHLIPFSTELSYTQHYLEIQKSRFRDRLRVEEDVRNTDQHVPPYLLQTLVENAFKHGLEKKTGEAVLIIRFRENDGFVTLEVIDNAVGLKESSEQNKDSKSGHGLDNIKRRLHLLFDERAEVRLEPIGSGGVRAIATWRTDSSGV